MEALGRLIDAQVIAPGASSTTWVSLKDAQACTIYAINTTAAANTFTVRIAKDGSGTGAASYGTSGDGVTRYWQKSIGVGTWTLTTGSAVTWPLAVSSTNTIGDVTAVDVADYQVPTGYAYVQAYGANVLIVIQPHDLKVQRKPANLRSLIA